MKALLPRPPKAEKAEGEQKERKSHHKDRKGPFGGHLRERKDKE